MTGAEGRQQPLAGRAGAGDREIRQVVDALCAELGVSARAKERRAAIESRVTQAYLKGRRQPLDLVHAGLEGHA
ncbi:hypothetical protein [Mesorhizobium xinjiangense]|uniref:hypothetical protein n=1 Tax=Mesorhizobium xinjiangense TaxID=2678685 RepID=UPI0012EDCE4E|nr:hypothetical protein [Mesorhizobium xinjiangense]